MPSNDFQSRHVLEEETKGLGRKFPADGLGTGH